MMFGKKQLGINYDFTNDVYTLFVNGIGLFYFEAEDFARFVRGCSLMIEKNHPELLPGSDIDALEQTKRILGGK